MTVLFCDLVDSTALSARLDAEQVHDLLRTYQDTAGQVIREFDGYVAQYLGDGLLVYLGYPAAHEDDAERAVRVGLGIVAAIQKVNAQLERDHGVRVSVRVGIHSGPVVVDAVGGGERREMLALGHTTNLAARVQSVAAADTVVLTAATLRLVRGLFVTKDLGQHRLKGFPEPIRVYAATRPGGVRSRFDLAESRGLTPLVGREQEVGLLLDRWERVVDGHGQAVLISGEMGIGKSRMVRELRQRVVHASHTWLECSCFAYAKNSAFYPVVELQAHALNYLPDDTPDAKLAKLEASLTRAAFPLAEYFPLFAELHALPLPAGYETPNLSPAAKKRKTIEALVEILLQLGREQPVLLLVEDLHWADPSTLELLRSVVDQVPTSRVLTVFTFRPEFVHPWPARSHITPIVVSRLTSAQSVQMIEGLVGQQRIPSRAIADLVRRADGVPLFTEELTRTVLEAAELAGDAALTEIPTSLHDSLMARLDQLGQAKEVAQLCAVLGREFPYDLLAAVSPVDRTTLENGLERLAQAELLYRRGKPPRATYFFRHALIQDEAYASLLHGVKRSYHQRIAEALESEFPDRALAQPELVAHHYNEAGVVPKAVQGWLKASRHALARSANAEAAQHVARGLTLVSQLPASLERTQLELTLQGTLGRALAAVKGRGAEDVRQAFARARVLCQELGDPPQLFPVTFGLWLFNMSRAEVTETLELSATLRSMAEAAGDTSTRMEARLAAGYTAFWQADYASARACLQEALALYDPAEHGTHALIYGQDPAAAAQVFEAWALCFQGHACQAAEAVQRALHLAERSRHPFTLAGVLWQAAVVLHELGDVEACLELADRAVAIGSEQGFATQVATGTILRGAAHVRRGEIHEGVVEIRQGLDAFRTSGALVTVPHYLALLADALRCADRPSEGLPLVEEGLHLARTHLDCYYEPELCRIRGELLLALRSQDAEASLTEALRVARAHGARSLELRAATSLARLWAAGDKRQPARDLLDQVCGADGDGGGGKDQFAATTLLRELT